MTRVIIKDRIDDFRCDLLGFMVGLHTCHACKHFVEIPPGLYKRIKRLRCLKYGNQPIQKVRKDCIDTFPGFTNDEMADIFKQYKAGICRLVINGVAV